MTVPIQSHPNTCGNRSAGRLSRLGAMFAALALPISAYAQQMTTTEGPAAQARASLEFTAGQFFTALAGGLILAVSFQFLLTHVLAAAGVNAAGFLSGKRSRGSGANPAGTRTQAATRAMPDVVHGLRRSIGAWGVWALITAGVSVFFASWIASRLALTASTAIGAIMGLVIWGAFYLTLSVVETGAALSLVGSLFRAAGGSLRSAYQAGIETMRKFAETEEETAGRIRADVRREWTEAIGPADIRQEILRYIEKLKPRPFNAADFQRELRNELNETELRVIAETEDPFLDQQMIVQFMQKQGGRGLTEEKARSVVRSVQDVVGSVRREAGAKQAAGARITEPAVPVGAVPQEEARRMRERFENYLRSTGKRELSSEGIKRDIQQMVADPRGGMDAMKNRLSQIDKGAAVALLSQRKDISQDEAKRIVEQVDQVVNQLKGQTQTRTAAEPGALTKVRDKIMTRIRGYLDSLDRTEFGYESLRNDIRELLRDPGQSEEDLRRRFKGMDRDAIREALASREDVAEEDAERILGRIEALRDEAWQQTERFGHEVQKRVEQAREEMAHRAEEAGRAATQAAWWSVAAATVSGVAAVLGGMAGVAG